LRARTGIGSVAVVGDMGGLLLWVGAEDAVSRRAAGARGVCEGC
jgi:hypothetical protein